MPLRGSGFAFHLSAPNGHVSTKVAQDAQVGTSKTYYLASVPRLRATGALCISSGGYNPLHLSCLQYLAVRDGGIVSWGANSSTHYPTLRTDVAKPLGQMSHKRDHRKPASLQSTHGQVSELVQSMGQCKVRLDETGGVQIDIRHLSIKGKVVCHNESIKEPHFSMWKRWARLAAVAGTPCTVRLAHAGRMSPARAGNRPGDMNIFSDSSAPVHLGNGRQNKKF